MPVIIDYQHAIHFTLRLESAPCPTEAIQSFTNFFERHFQLESYGYRSECVVNVVHSRHMQCQVTDHVAAPPNTERRAKIVVIANTMSRDVSLSAKSVRHSAPLK